MMYLDNYVAYHLHSQLSLLDSCTNFKLYSHKAKELGQIAIGFSEHGNILQWVEKKMYCESLGLKYLHAVEIYLTETHDVKIRDNYHTILVAKNHAGVMEINKIIDISSQQDHKYYKDRISFDEFIIISDSVIKISACLASPLSQLPEEHPRYIELLNHYDYLEVQPHINSEDQAAYNKKLAALSKRFGIPLICGTDTHSLDAYKAECRSILQAAKGIVYSNEDEFDLTYKSYDELVDMFARQGALPEEVYLEAIHNTVVMADSVEEFELDLSFKYPKLYDDEEEVFKLLINRKYKEKLDGGVIKNDKRYLENIKEEFAVFKKLGMIGFILFMAELSEWCDQHNIPRGPCRGSVGGSTIAYISGITDVDPVLWDTVFSRFCNEDRLEVGDVDLDVKPEDRDMVYQYIIDRFGEDYTAFIVTTGTVAEKGTIDEIGRAFHNRWVSGHPDEKEKDSPYHLEKIAKIKQLYESDPEAARKQYSELFYYFDGLHGSVISAGVHPAGIVASPVALPENYGTFWNGDKRVICINMEEIHEISIVKYDVLSLKNIGVIKDTCKLLDIPYPKAHEVNWADGAVWEDIITSPAGIFQFESSYAFDSLRKFKPGKINDMSLVTAAIRPSGALYRDRLLAKEFNKNPSEIIDEMLKDNNGFLCFQEDTTRFLKEICGFTGNEADNVRRAIGRKDEERLEAALPKILDGYCKMSDKPREVAEQEAKDFLQIISDSSRYQFNYNHSIGYSMIGYLCAMLRYYYPLEFITALLNNADNESDIVSGTELARLKKIKIQPIRFRYSNAHYTPDKKTNSIYKGLESVKYCNRSIGEELYALRDKEYDGFYELLSDIKQTSCDSRQLDILIKLDFFNEFGSSKFLLALVDTYNFFKQGDVKQIKKTAVQDEIIRNIIERYARSTPKTYVGLDADSVRKIFNEVEQYYQAQEIPDFSMKEKIGFSQEYLGYIDVQTRSQEDRNKLFVVSVAPLKTKDKSKVWAYKLKTVSLCYGKNSDITIYSNIFNKCPVSAYDTLFVKSEWIETKENNGYTNRYAYDYKIIA